MAYNEIPQSAINSVTVPRLEFGQYTRDNFISHENELIANTTEIADHAGRLDGVETKNVNQDSAITSLDTRVTTLESNPASSITGGVWQASNVSQTFAQGVGEDILLNTEVKAPVDITNNLNGTWTVNRTGWWSFTLAYDLRLDLAIQQEWLIVVSRVSSGLSIAGFQFTWHTNAWSIGTASGFDYLTAGESVRCNGVWYGGGSANYTGVSVNRTKFAAMCGGG